LLLKQAGDGAGRGTRAVEIIEKQKAATVRLAPIHKEGAFVV
jgi:hypothetical protein